jgi:hypothetical protein
LPDAPAHSNVKYIHIEGGCHNPNRSACLPLPGPIPRMHSQEGSLLILCRTRPVAMRLRGVMPKPNERRMRLSASNLLTTNHPINQSKPRLCALRLFPVGRSEHLRCPAPCRANPNPRCARLVFSSSLYGGSLSYSHCLTSMKERVFVFFVQLL